MHSTRTLREMAWQWSRRQRVWWVARWRGLPAKWLLGACVAGALVLGAPTLNPQLTSARPSLQQELSWQAVILDAIATRARFGVDVVYTFGPMADVYLHQYHPAVWRRALLAKVALVLLLGVYAWYLAMLTPTAGWRRNLASLALVLPASQMNNDLVPEGVFLALVAMTQLAYVARRSAMTHAVSALVGACLTLAKFSFAPLFGLTLLLPVIVETRWRRGWLLAALGSSWLPIFWLISGQQLQDLLPFLIGGRDQVRGYASAMSYDYPWMRSQVWMVLPCLVAVIWFSVHLRFASAVRQRVAVVLAMGCTAVLVFKAGFTRHDLHVWIPFVWLASVGLAIVLLSRARWFWLLGYCAAFASFGHDVAITIGPPYSLPTWSAARERHAALAALGASVSTHAPVHAQYIQELDKIRALPLARLVRKWQPADVDARNQIPALLERRARPNLRPVFQSSNAYTDDLAARNVSYLARLPAGATIIIESWTHDGRHPGLQQSGAWIMLLRDFELVEHSPPFVVLRKKEGSRMTCEPVNSQGQLGDFVEVPARADGAMVIARPLLEATPWGRGLGSVFRETMVRIDTRAGSSTEEDRYIVGMGQQGFLVQPALREPGDLAALWDRRARRASLQVRLRSDDGGLSYKSAFDWRLQVCHVDGEERAARNDRTGGEAAMRRGAATAPRHLSHP